MPFLILLLLLLAGCHQPTDPPTIYTGTEMTIDYRILVGTSVNAVQDQAIKTIIRRTFDEVNDTYNKWNPRSELSQINQMKGGIWIEISPSLEHLLRLTHEDDRTQRRTVRSHY